MYAPVDEHSAAGDFLGRERSAESGNRTVSAEVDVYMVYLSELARLNHFADLVDRGVEAVDDADVQNLAGLMLDALHLERFVVGASRRLFAEHILTGAQEVAGDDRVHFVRCADRNRGDLRIVQNLVVVVDCLAAAVLLNGGVSPLRNDVAEILDFGVRAGEIARDVRGVRDSTAADNGNLDWHDINPP